MNENKSKEEKWREEFEKDIPSYNLNKIWNGDYFLERIHYKWIGYLAGRKAGQEEIDMLLSDHIRTNDELIHLNDKFEKLKAENERLSDMIHHQRQREAGLNLKIEAMAKELVKADLITPKFVSMDACLKTENDDLKEENSQLKKDIESIRSSANNLE